MLWANAKENIEGKGTGSIGAEEGVGVANFNCKAHTTNIKETLLNWCKILTTLFLDNYFILHFP
jgi:hypothetical protein